ncbi:histidine decarboxylase isoform X2 [Rhinatrema bivittatum]|uniref:histidine decarboxylase isoform X2 n=1 Tax=Rhinatrema bivittatum TaxID=194408 RepID=UPI001129D182|nr:histidine decarboxylase isoform X2 [Rhinatrema bivittatum]
MEPEEYRRRGKEMVDYIYQYLSTVKERRVNPQVQPGYMRLLLPDSAPLESESWDDIFRDIEDVIMPGASSPACTELEMNVMDWLAKMLGLPDHFLHHCPNSNGGGVLQSTVSESTLVALLAARKNAILEMKSAEPDADESWLNSRLIAYTSDQAHSSVEKAGLISLVKIKFLPVDDNFSLRGETLRKAIEEDRDHGLVPFFICATLGTTGVCAFDCLTELGPICASEGLWLHIDAAYAGTAFLCPEFRRFLDGVQFADSFTFNPSKWMMVHFDCTAFWVKDKYKLQQTFSVNPLYLRHANSGAATDFMHWQIPLSRRFRSLKLWFVIRSFGVKNLQAHIRHGTEMAKLFESLVRSNHHFEIPAKRHLGLVVFRLKGPNSLTEQVLKELTKSGKMFLIPAMVHDKFIIRFTVTSQFTVRDDILRDWNLILQTATDVVNRHYMLQPGNPADCIISHAHSPETTANNGTWKLHTEAGEDKMSAGKITEQPRQEVVSPKDWATQNTGDEADPFDDCFPEEVSKHKPSSSIHRYLSGQESKKSGRSLSCNSVPVNGLKELATQTLTTTDDFSENGSHHNESILSKLPKKVMILERNAFRKLIKFYSVPSFPECSIQCGLQLPCCPLQAIV